MSREVIGANARQHAAVTADRGPQCIQDHCVCHRRRAYTRPIDEFAVFVLFGFIVAIGILLALGKWYPGSGAEQVDWHPTRSPEVEAELELDDVEQMLEAQNARRRASGRPERTEEDVRLQVAEDERWREELRRRAREADDG
ncbi:MAG: hypothetical protein QOD13_907 [Thermoleophilaceae bacterium]|nr:hypothetical protein [Thermoleophilaceae bacterium]